MTLLEEVPAFGKLIESWRRIYVEATPRERAELAKTMGDMLAGVADGWGRAWIADTTRALELFVAMCHSTGRPGGFVLERDPAWLSRALFERLAAEAEAGRPRREYGVANHYSDAGPAAEEVARLPAFCAWLALSSGLPLAAFKPEVALSYIHYEAGEACPLHIDDPRTHELNLLLCVQHRPASGGGAGSELRLHLADGPRSFLMRPGDTLLFRGDRVPHARTPLAPGERIAIFSMGFKVLPGFEGK